MTVLHSPNCSNFTPRSDPILFYIDHFENDLHKPEFLPSGIYELAVLDNFIIGKMKFVRLFPFMARRTDMNYNYGRVKVRINGKIANVTEEIPRNDLMNNLFHKKCGPENIHQAERISSAL